MHELVTREELVQRLDSEGRLTYVMLVGLHGSGKTSIANALHDCGFVRLSMDRIVSKHPMLGMLWLSLEAKFLAKLRKRLSERKNIVDDNLNVSAHSRAAVLSEVRAAGYERVVIVFVDTPLSVCLRRNATRGDRAPDWVIEQLYGQLHDLGLPRASEAELVLIVPNEDETRYLARFEGYKPIAQVNRGRTGLIESLRKWLFWSLEQVQRLI